MRRALRRPRGDQLFNFLAAIFSGLSVLMLAWVAAVAVQPHGAHNPFPPPTLIAQAAVPTATVMPASSTPMSPVETPFAPTASAMPTVAVGTPTVELTAARDTPTAAIATATVSISLTTSPVATATASIATATAVLTASATPAPTPTRSVLTYTASITYLVHPVQVCDWLGIGGTVADLMGKQTPASFVHIWGLDNFDQFVAAGSSPNYGSSGWEVRLARSQLVGKWNVQMVVSPEMPTPLSEVYTVSMPGDCKRNLALVRFQQNH